MRSTEMRNYLYLFVISLTTVTLFSCNDANEKADGYGNFEATEITVSAENNGKLMAFEINEGDKLTKNAMVGYIDTVSLQLKREQLEISKAVVRSKSKGVLSEIAVLNAKLKTANINKQRAENLLKDNAGTQKQLDDILGEINVINSQVNSVGIQNAPVVSELKSIDVQARQIEDQIQKSKIINPVNGTVLAKYSEAQEISSFGKPLYKIADLSKMQLRVYLSETQLASLKIGQEVTVKIDDSANMKSYKGFITWIAADAEFTPKIIQTKKERVALVYAVKVDVKNDGSLKIGMPAELWLNDSAKNK